MTGRTILYVEDNDDNVYVLRGRLERMGFEVRVASDGIQGVSMAREVMPDLMLSETETDDVIAYILSLK